MLCLKRGMRNAECGKIFPQKSGIFFRNFQKNKKKSGIFKTAEKKNCLIKSGISAKKMTKPRNPNFKKNFKF